MGQMGQGVNSKSIFNREEELLYKNRIVVAYSSSESPKNGNSFENIAWSSSISELSSDLCNSVLTSSILLAIALVVIPKFRASPSGEITTEI